MSAKPTPTPWKFIDVIGGCSIWAGDRCVLSYLHSPDPENKANAAHIVRCVNAMPAMIEALEEAAAHAHNKEFLDKINAALALAKGE